MAESNRRMDGALLTLGLVAMFATASVTYAQVVSRDPTTHNPVTAQEIDRRLATRAAEVQKLAPQGAERMALFDVAWPATPDEARALGFNGVLFVAALSKQPDELPLARVYAKILLKPVNLRRISGQRHEVAADDVAAKVFGPYRDDAFYLLPAKSWRSGLIAADFAKNRKGFSISNTSLNPPDFIRMGRGDSGSPLNEALDAFIRREFPGLGH